MIKYITSLLSLALILSGCLMRDEIEPMDIPPPKEKSVIKMAHYLEINNAGKPYDVGMGKIFERFTDEMGIEIELSCFTWDQIDRQLVVSNKAGEPGGDIYAISSQKLFYLVNNDALLPLDNYLNASFPENVFHPNVLKAGTYPGDGKFYLMMQSIHTRGLWYNKDYIPHPPKTLEELVQIGKEVTRPQDDFYAFGFWGGNHYGSVEETIAPFAWSGDGSLSFEDGSAAWDNPAVEKAIQFMSDCVNVYNITPEYCLATRDYVDVQTAFRDGRLAMIMDGNFAYHLNNINPDNHGKFGFAPFPGSLGNAPNFSNGWAWGIPKKSKNPDLAWQFIEWFEQDEIQLDHALLEGTIPTRTATYNEMRDKMDLFDNFLDNLTDYGRPMDSFVYYQEGLTELAVTAATACLDPGSDIKELLKTSADSFNRKYYLVP